MLWTSIEPTLGVIGACLPTLRPLFSGISPESVIRSIRSQISLHSLRSPKSSPKGSTKGSRNTTSHSGPSSESNERFAHTVEGLGTVENHITSMGLEDRDQREKTWDGRANGIHINQNVYQRTEDMV